ncbi:MAG: GNAT family N-acetyltransferase [Flavipsychrobacter sp.]|nr:GNAT family N-acetyltransferase [Flavipsychrobacter sp.]
MFEDIEQYHSLIDRNRKRLEDFFAGTVAITKTIEDTRQHLTDVITKFEKKAYFPLAVIEHKTNSIIGSIQIKSIDWQVRKGELGYYIDEGYEGQGIITESIALIIDYGFNDLGFNKFYIRTYAGNIGSKRIAEKNGFLLEGNLRAEYKTTSGRLIDIMYYGLLNPNTLRD